LDFDTLRASFTVSHTHDYEYGFAVQGVVEKEDWISKRFLTTPAIRFSAGLMEAQKNDSERVRYE
jgi:hypothetical protein